MNPQLTYSQKTFMVTEEKTRQILRSLPSACRDFILSIEPTTQPLTRYAYALDLRVLFHYLISEVPLFADKSEKDFTDADWDEITSQHLSSYLNYLNLYFKSDDTFFTNENLGKMRKMATVRSFFKYLYKNKRISRDESTLVDMPKRHEKPIIRLEIDEVAKLLDAAESGEQLSHQQKKFAEHTRLRDMTILYLFLGTGMRVSELVGLDLQHIDLNINGLLVTRKGGNQAILYFPDEVADVLQAYLPYRSGLEALPGHENALFLSLQKKRISVDAIENMVKKYARIAAPLKQKISPHKLRATFGTNLYHETGDIYLVADVLGHADVNTTRRHYAAMSDDRRRMAARSVILRDADANGTTPPLPPKDAQEAKVDDVSAYEAVSAPETEEEP